MSSGLTEEQIKRIDVSLTHYQNHIQQAKNILTDLHSTSDLPLGAEYHFTDYVLRGLILEAKMKKATFQDPTLKISVLEVKA